MTNLRIRYQGREKQTRVHPEGSGSGVLHDEVWRRLLRAVVLSEDPVPRLLEGVGKIERLGELGVEERVGAEAGLDHEQLRRTRGVAVEEGDAGPVAFIGLRVPTAAAPAGGGGGGEGGGGGRDRGRRAEEGRRRRRGRGEGGEEDSGERS